MLLDHLDGFVMDLKKHPNFKATTSDKGWGVNLKFTPQPLSETVASTYLDKEVYFILLNIVKILFKLDTDLERKQELVSLKDT